MEYQDTEVYKDLYKKYMKGTLEDIMYLYTLHEKLSYNEGDFHSIGREVCKDILKERDLTP